MDEGGRGLVEEVGVVDADHEAASPSPARQLLGDVGQKLQPAGHARKTCGKKVGERAEGNGCVCPGGDDPRRRGPLGLGPGDGLTCQAGLAHPCGAGEDDGVLSSGKRPGQMGELGLAPEQRPALGNTRPNRTPR